MQSARTFTRTFGALAVLTTGLALSTLARADSYTRGGMNDYDQKKSTLPNTGKYYCVPTSYVDVFMYMAAHGMPSMDGGYGTNYSDITSFQFALSIMMGTDFYKGTSFSTAYDVASSWIFNHTSHLVYSIFYGPDWDWGTGTIKNVLRTGAVVVIGRGHYQWDGNDYDRVAGHAVVLTGYNYTGSSKQIYVRDPNDDANLTTQSDFTTVTKDTANMSLDTEDHGVVTHARYTFNTGSGNDRYMIDNMHQILPMFAGWTTGASAGTTFKVYWPFIWVEATHGGPASMTFTTSKTVVDWCFDIGEVAIYYVTNTGELHRIDFAENTDTQIASIAGANKVAVGGPGCDIYVLKKVLFSGGDTLVKVNRSTFAQTARALPKHLVDIDWDVKGNDVAGISTDLGAVYRVDPDLTTIKTDGIFQPSWASPALAVSHFAIDHVSGDMIVGEEGQTSYRRFRRTNNRWISRTVSYRGVTGIQTIVPGEQGLTFIQDGSKIWTTDSMGNYINTDFSGLDVEGQIQLSRSYVATKPGSMSSPGWFIEDSDSE